ncbi:MAG TPA: hypothetical protein VJ045_02830 [Hyphomicrobiaceae bacterium]|nr:hypothetical protein [Hyphomicrobiaceae bacterium]
MSQQASLSLLRERRDNIREWLDEEAPYTTVDQKHLDAHTPEQAYWHHGYQAALSDIMALLATGSGKTGSADIPN